MFIETWIAVMIIVSVFILAFISLLGWMANDQELKKERAANKELVAENKRLAIENTQIRAKLCFIRLHIEQEKK